MVHLCLIVELVMNQQAEENINQLLQSFAKVMMTCDYELLACITHAGFNVVSDSGWDKENATSFLNSKQLRTSFLAMLKGEADEKFEPYVVCRFISTEIEIFDNTATAFVTMLGEQSLHHKDGMLKRKARLFFVFSRTQEAWKIASVYDSHSESESIPLQMP